MNFLFKLDLDLIGSGYFELYNYCGTMNLNEECIFVCFGY